MNECGCVSIFNLRKQGREEFVVCQPLPKNVDIFYICYRYRGAFQIEILGLIFNAFFLLYFPHLIINQYCGFRLLNTFAITSSKAFSEQPI